MGSGAGFIGPCFDRCGRRMADNRSHPPAACAGMMDVMLMRDKINGDDFRVEALDEDGGREVAMFSGPGAREWACVSAGLAMAATAYWAPCPNRQAPAASDQERRLCPAVIENRGSENGPTSCGKRTGARMVATPTFGSKRRTWLAWRRIRRRACCPIQATAIPR